MQKLFGKSGLIARPLLCAILLLPLSISAFCYTVQPCAQPTITSVKPSTWVAGQTYNVIVTGTGFLNISNNCNTIYLGPIFTNPGNEIFNFSAVSDTEITGTVTLPASEPTQTACFRAEDVENDVVRRTSGGSPSACPAYSNDFGTVVPFAVSVCSIPTITSVSPNVWFTGQRYVPIITGTGFITPVMAAATGCPVSTVNVSTPGRPSSLTVPVSGTGVVSATQIVTRVAPSGVSSPADPSGAFYGAAGATVEVTNVPPGQSGPVPAVAAALLTPAAGSASAPVDVVGTTAIQWTSDPDGTSPIISGTTQQAVVGQKIVLTGSPTAAQFSGLPIALTIPSPSAWTIGGAEGTNVGGYSPTNAGASVTETTLTGPTLTTYWVYPGTYPVSYESCVDGQAATPALYDCTTATATFEVSGPNGPNATGTMTFSPFSPSVSIADLDSCTDSNGVFWRAGPYLAYAQNYSGTPCPGQGFMETFGISFNSPTGYQNTSGGNFVLVQLIGSDVVTGGCCTQPAGLDTKYPYGLLPSNDNPITYLPPTITNASRTFTANMFLMWQSTTTGSIPVPVGYQNWGFSGTATCKANCGSASNWTATNTPGTTPGPVGNFVTSDPSQTQTNDKNNVLVDGYPTWAGPPSY